MQSSFLLWSSKPVNHSPTSSKSHLQVTIFARSLATTTKTTAATKKRTVKPAAKQSESDIKTQVESEDMEFDEVLYTPIIDRILKAGDLASISSKDVRKALQKELGYDITDQKAEITGLIRKRFDEILEETGPENVHPVKQETNGYDNVKKEDPGASPSKKRKSTTVKRKAVAPRKKKKSSATISDDSGVEDGGEKKKKRKINANNPFHQPLILSPQLSTLLGETQLSRPETVKRIWAYIKQNELQDQNDKRYIICDENLRTVFPTAKVHMFTMNKILSGHLYPMNKSDNIADVKSEDIKSEDFASSPVSVAFSQQGSPSSLESEAS
ncbi:uncharacterized protein DFL_008943 [Arthrobotrys flagrans]|uniref:Uncharacterized protein n=1 Tax=Arthrobotrys flagrans TaxID=97331 RepID=A0A436ZQH7_ARTFL|nr:hypothetical protein DFL_008943 [Arthrobotrys flagrans]